MIPSSPLRVGVLGCGRIGQMHAGLLATRVPGVVLVGVYDVEPSAAAAVATRFGVPAAGSVDALIDASDAVAIITTTDTHAALIERVATAGKPAFCEKPVSLDLATVDHAVAAVEAAGTLLQIGFNRRFDATNRTVHDAAASGALGDIWMVKVTSRDNPCPPIEFLRRSGGLFLDMSIHDFDMARWLSGSPVVEVFAQGTAVDPAIAAIGDIDTAVVTLRHASGCISIIDNSRHAGFGYDQRIEAFGSQATAFAENPLVNSASRRDAGGLHAAPMYHSFHGRYADSFTAEWVAFAGAVRTGSPSPVSGRDARVPLVIGIAANESLRLNRPVAIDPT